MIRVLQINHPLGKHGSKRMATGIKKGKVLLPGKAPRGFCAGCVRRAVDIVGTRAGSPTARPVYVQPEIRA